MSAPTHEQRVRSALNGLARKEGLGYAATFAVDEAVSLAGLAGRSYVLDVLTHGEGLMGVREVAAALKVPSPTNVGKVAGLPAPVARVSNGTTPVWLGIDIVEFAAERERRRHG